jgi:hypothetical protein
VALLEKRGFLYNHSGDFPQVILIVPSHVPNIYFKTISAVIETDYFILNAPYCYKKYYGETLPQEKNWSKSV